LDFSLAGEAFNHRIQGLNCCAPTSTNRHFAGWLASMTNSFVYLAGSRLELVRLGRGRPLLMLCSEEALELAAPVLNTLAEQYELIIPSPPGFGRSDRPEWVMSPDDISYVYLDLVDALGLKDAVVLGASLGGWIAAEMATKNDGFIAQLILVSPYGVKFGGPTERDIADIWMLPAGEVLRRKWFDPVKGTRDFKSMPEDALAIVARNNESFARFCWEPYMHNPKLPHRLHRVKVPTLLVCGANDGITSPAYGSRYAKLIAGAELAVIPEAGHYPHLEQPAKFMEHLRAFLG
jgi:pimeloyl-ACP methyl ester carboxylesterase